MPAPFGGWYSASKAALASASAVLDAEVRGFGIFVTVVAPGLFRTPMAGQLSSFPVAPDSAYAAMLTAIRRALPAAWTKPATRTRWPAPSTSASGLPIRRPGLSSAPTLRRWRRRSVNPAPGNSPGCCETTSPASPPDRAGGSAHPAASSLTRFRSSAISSAPWPALGDRQGTGPSTHSRLTSGPVRPPGVNW